MSKADGAVAWALAIANDKKHGYDQQNRWGPDYDCSSLVISAWESVGVTVREAGASYTGNMRAAFLACGFRDVTASVSLGNGVGLRLGDVLLNYASHTAMSVGGGKIVAARSNEQGKAVGGITGDQTGHEISTMSYFNYPWNCVLRYEGKETVSSTPAASEAKKEEPFKLPTLSTGSKGWMVVSVQGMLIAHSFSCGPEGADGDYGYNTRQAVLNFQRAKGLTLDGIVGEETWKALLGVMG